MISEEGIEVETTQIKDKKMSCCFFLMDEEFKRNFKQFNVYVIRIPKGEK